MKYYLLTFSIIILGCSQNIGSLSIASTQPVEIDKKYESIELIEGESELVTSSSRKMVNIDKAIDNALTLFEADIMTDLGIRYEKEIAQKNSKIKLDGLPSQDGKNVQN